MENRNLPQLEISVDPSVVADALKKSLSEFWNPKPLQNYVAMIRETNKNLVVTEENLKEMTELSRELGGKATKIDTVRKELKKVMKAPIDEFESQIKTEVEGLHSVKKPIDTQIAVFEDARRKEAAEKVQEWIAKIAEQFNLRPEFAGQIEVDEKWTNKTAKRADVEALIRGKALTLQEAQKAMDREVELKEEKRQAAIEFCKTQSEIAGLITPITADEILNIDEIPLVELAGHITKLALNRKQAEENARNAVSPTEPEPVPCEKAPEPVSEIKEDDDLYPCVLNLMASAEQMKKLKTFLDSEKIQYKFRRNEQ